MQRTSAAPKNAPTFSGDDMAFDDFFGTATGAVSLDSA